MDTQEEDIKQHFWIGCVSLVIDRGSRKEDVKFNVIVRTSNNFLNERNIGYMQQSAQHRYHTINPNAEQAGLHVVDAVINSISYIGIMSEKEFLIERTPELTDESTGVEPTEPNEGGGSPSVGEGEYALGDERARDPDSE